MAHHLEDAPHPNTIGSEKAIQLKTRKRKQVSHPVVSTTIRSDMYVSSGSSDNMRVLTVIQGMIQAKDVFVRNTSDHHHSTALEELV